MGQPATPPGRTAAPTERARVRRLAERGLYDRTTIYAILDEGFICHLGLAVEGGPIVIPTTYARVEGSIYLHGAPGNATLRALAAGAPACVTVTLLDGLVLARAALHHSVNYRSVVIFGTAVEVTGTDEKRRGLMAVVEHIVPGRSADTRPPTDSELRATRLIHMPIDEASAKVRTGGPSDEPIDAELGFWAGQLPLRLEAQTPVPEPGSPTADRSPPGYLSSYTRVGWR